MTTATVSDKTINIDTDIDTDDTKSGIKKTRPGFSTAGNGVNQASSDLTQKIARVVTNLPMVAPDWTNRRRIIFMSIYFCGGCIGIICATVAAAIMSSIFTINHGQIDQNLMSLAESIVYACSFVGSSIVGTYCFSAAYEHIQYRNDVMDMTTKIATSSAAISTTPTTNS